MQEKHWVKVWALVGGPPGTLLNFNLNQLLEHGIDAHVEKVEEYSAYAAGEASILKTIAEIKSIWDTLAFVVTPYRDTKDRYIIKDIEEAITLLEDH